MYVQVTCVLRLSSAKSPNQTKIQEVLHMYPISIIIYQHITLHILHLTLSVIPISSLSVNQIAILALTPTNKQIYKFNF